jgi:hypothetical protein
VAASNERGQKFARLLIQTQTIKTQSIGRMRIGELELAGNTVGGRAEAGPIADGQGNVCGGQNCVSRAGYIGEA